MKNLLKLLFALCLIMQAIPGASQNKAAGVKTPKLEVYYFHPSERCPIDQSIEEATRKMMRTDFAKEVKDGTIKFQVLNTDEKANEKTVAKFEMNAQALYLVYPVNGKEVKKDLTEFAFSTCQSNPGKFKAELRDEILKAIR